MLFSQDKENTILKSLQGERGFKTLLQKGAIPAIRHPEFVTAVQALMPDDAWVIGVSRGKQSKAYSINLLNHHEIVNDVLDAKPIAAVW